MKSAGSLRAATTSALSEPDDHELRLFSDLIQAHAGIQLRGSKKALLHARLAPRVQELGLGSYGAYFDLISHEKSGVELTRMIDRIAPGETQFFREPLQLEYLTEHLFREWSAEAATRRRSRHLRVWSAACSTGEEPFSLAMLLLTHFPRSAGWTLDIRATDISTRALEAARRATWPIEKAGQIPADFLRRFMLRGTGEHKGRLRASDPLRAVVRFEKFNLNADFYPATPLFDLILCRNVLIHFDAERRRHVHEKLISRLVPGGHLLVGHAESVSAADGRLATVRPTIYQHKKDCS